MRFYAPGQSQYVSQFAQLPLDWMYENIKSQQDVMDKSLYALNSQKFAVDRLRYGERGFDQSMDATAKAIENRYTGKIKGLVDEIYNDPRSASRAAAKLAKITSEFENDPEVLLHAKINADYKAEQKRQAAAENYPKSVYGKRQSVHLYEPYLQDGSINPYVGGDEYGTYEDYEKLFREQMAGIKPNSNEWQSLRSFGDIGFQTVGGSKEMVTRDDVLELARLKADLILNTKQGQFYVDKAMSERPELQRYITNDEYYQNINRLKQTPMEGHNMKVQYQDGKEVKEKEVQMSVYDYIAKNVISDMFATGANQIYTATSSKEGNVNFIPQDIRESIDNAGRTIYDVSNATSPTSINEGKGMGVNIDGLWEINKNTGKLEPGKTFWDDVWNAAKGSWVGSLLNFVVPGSGILPGLVGAFSSESIIEPVEKAFNIDLTSNSSKSSELSPEQFNNFRYMTAKAFPNKKEYDKFTKGLTITKKPNGGYNLDMTKESQNAALKYINEDLNKLMSVRTSRDDKERDYLFKHFFIQEEEGKDAYTINSAARATLGFIAPNGQVVNTKQIAESFGIKDDESDNLTFSYNGRANNANAFGDVNVMKVVNKKTGEEMELMMPSYQNNIRYNDGKDSYRIAQYYNNEFGKFSLTSNRYFATPIDNRNHTEYLMANRTTLPSDEVMNMNISKYHNPLGAVVNPNNGEVSIVFYNAQSPDDSKVITTYKNVDVMRDKANTGTLGVEIYKAISNMLPNK